MLCYFLMENELYSFALDVLRVIHVIGKDTTNIFSPSDSLKAEGDIEHMTEGFKSHLIRLIGNLCYKNKENQDKVRLFLRVPHRTLFRACCLEFRIPSLCRRVKPYMNS